MDPGYAAILVAIIGVSAPIWKRLGTIHKMVNSRMDEAMDKIESLESRLAESEGLEPPPTREEMRPYDHETD